MMRYCSSSSTQHSINKKEGGVGFYSSVLNHVSKSCLAHPKVFSAGDEWSMYGTTSNIIIYSFLFLLPVAVFDFPILLADKRYQQIILITIAIQRKVDRIQ